MFPNQNPVEDERSPCVYSHRVLAPRVQGKCCLRAFIMHGVGFGRLLCTVSVATAVAAAVLVVVMAAAVARGRHHHTGHKTLLTQHIPTPRIHEDSVATTLRRAVGCTFMIYITI